MTTRRISTVAGLSLCAILCLCFTSTGCSEGSAVNNLKTGSGGFSTAEKQRMTGGPTADDKKAMEEAMKKMNTGMPDAAKRGGPGAVAPPGPGKPTSP